MTVTRYDSIRAAERAIRALEANGSASQRYCALRGVERSFWRCTWLRMNPFRLLRALCRRPFRTYVVCDADGAVLCVAPLERKPRGWSVVVGEYVMLDYVDFLYADLPSDELASAVRMLAQRLVDDGISQLTWDFLPDASRTADLLASFPRQVEETFDNVSLDTRGAGSWEAYLAGLGSTARHNLRKGYARAAAAGLTVSFSLERPPARAALHESREVYVRRQAQRYDHAGWLAGFYFRHLNYISLSVPGDVGFLAVLRLGGRLAASMEGYVNVRRGALEVPRISMDGDFAAYGPGRLLVAECLRWMMASAGLSVLDLCRGGERYKYDLGGTRYPTRRVTYDFGGLAA